MHSEHHPEPAALREAHRRLQDRHRRLKNRVWLASLAAAAFALGVITSPAFIADARAGVITDLKADMASLNSVLKNLASILAAIDTEDNLKAMNQIDDLINEAHALMVDNKNGIAAAVRQVGLEMHQMNYNMFVMTANMQRMSNTVTPAMGQMNDMMRWFPKP